MNKERKKQIKQKKREKKVQEALRKRREGLRKDKKEKKEEFLEDKKFRKEQKELQKYEEIAEEIYNKLPPETRQQLEHNIQILRALEEEYDRELLSKEKLNAELEEEGHTTPEAKINALKERALKETKETANVEIVKSNSEDQISIGGSADCSFEPNEES